MSYPLKKNIPVSANHTALKMRVPRTLSLKQFGGASDIRLPALGQRVQLPPLLDWVHLTHHKTLLLISMSASCNGKEDQPRHGPFPGDEPALWCCHGLRCVSACGEAGFAILAWKRLPCDRSHVKGVSVNSSGWPMKWPGRNYLAVCIAFCIAPTSNDLA